MKAIFFDRDGVINKMVKRIDKRTNLFFDDSPFDLSELHFYPEVRSIFDLVKKKNFLPLIVTNQPGYLKEERSLKNYEELSSAICAFLGINRSQIFECFHKEGYSLECGCRKPKPGLFLMAKGMFNLNLQESIMIGDSKKDILAAKSAYLGRTIYLKRNKEGFQEGNFSDYLSMINEKIYPDLVVKTHFELKKLLGDIL